MPSARASAEARGFSAEPAAAGASKEAGTRPEGQQTGFDKPPSHYDGGNGLEAIDRIWRILRTLSGDDAMVAFCVGNALKYECARDARPTATSRRPAGTGNLPHTSAAKVPIPASPVRALCLTPTHRVR